MSERDAKKWFNKVAKIFTTTILASFVIGGLISYFRSSGITKIFSGFLTYVGGHLSFYSSKNYKETVEDGKKSVSFFRRKMRKVKEKLSPF